MLNGKLQLWDVLDVEAFCARIVERTQPGLGFHDREELLAFLVAKAWELSRDYDPDKASFSTFAGGALRTQVAEWQRAKNGRTVWRFSGGRVHERPLPKLHSLDDRPGLLDTDRQMEARPDRVSSLGRLFGTGDSRDPRRDDTLGEEPDRSAA